MSKLLLGEADYDKIASETGVGRKTVWNVNSKLKAHLKRMNMLDEVNRDEVNPVNPDEADEVDELISEVNLKQVKLAGEVPQTSPAPPTTSSPVNSVDPEANPVNSVNSEADSEANSVNSVDPEANPVNPPNPPTSPEVNQLAPHQKFPGPH